MKYEDVKEGDIVSVTSRYSDYLSVTGRVMKVYDTAEGLGLKMVGPLSAMFYDTLWELTRVASTKRPDPGSAVRFYTDEDNEVIGRYKDGRFVGIDGYLEEVDIPYDEVVSWSYVPSEGVL